MRRFSGDGDFRAGTACDGGRIDTNGPCPGVTGQARCRRRIEVRKNKPLPTRVGRGQERERGVQAGKPEASIRSRLWWLWWIANGLASRWRPAICGSWGAAPGGQGSGFRRLGTRFRESSAGGVGGAFVVLSERPDKHSRCQSPTEPTDFLRLNEFQVKSQAFIPVPARKFVSKAAHWSWPCRTADVAGRQQDIPAAESVWRKRRRQRR